MSSRTLLILSMVAGVIAVSVAFALWARASHRQEAIVKVGGKPVKVAKNVYYGFPGLKETALDIYTPVASGGAPVPLVVWIHGGAWMSGNKEYPPYSPFLERGMAVAAINYRFSTKEKFPAQIEDCKQAIRWLRKNGAEYGIDTERIGAFGISAGGHLAALLGTASDITTLDSPAAAADISPRVQAVVDWSGPANFSTIVEQSRKTGSTMDYSSDKSPLKLLLGGSLGEKSREAVAASPVTYASADDPPFFIMHGGRDEIVPAAQSAELNEALTKAGVRVRYEVLPEGGHMIATPPNLIKAVDFLEQNLRSKSAH